MSEFKIHIQKGPSMTACLYVCPGSLPAIISDCMIVYPGAKEQKNRPATLDFEADILSNPSFLARKTYILSEKTAVTFAGDVDQIQDALYTLTGIINSLQKPDDIVNAHNSIISNYPGIESILVNISGEFSEKMVSHSVKGPSPMNNLPLFGNNTAIGVGYKEMLEKLSSYDRHADAFDPLSKYPLELIQSLSSSINSFKLSAEIVGADPREWGGFIENVYYDPFQRSWVRSPKMLYLYYTVLELPGERYTAFLYPRAFCYEPGEGHGGVMVWSRESEEGRALEFPILDIRSDPDSSWRGKDFWESWQPEAATITFLRYRESNIFKSATVTTVEKEIDDIVFYMKGKESRVGATDALISYYARKAYKYTGYEYIPIDFADRDEIDRALYSRG